MRRRKPRAVPPGKVAYVIQARNWEYNDEYYVDQGVGESKNAYLSEARANEECDRLNVEALRDHDRLCDFGGGDGDIFSTEFDLQEAADALVKLGIPGPDYPAPKTPDPKEEEAKKLRARLKELGKLGSRSRDEDEDDPHEREMERALQDWQCEFRIPKDLPDDKVREAMRVVSVRFFEVVPVSLDDVTS